MRASAGRYNELRNRHCCGFCRPTTGAGAEERVLIMGHNVGCAWTMRAPL